MQNDGEITNFEVRVINNDDNDKAITIWALPNPASNEHTDQDQWKEGRVQILDELGEKEYQVSFNFVLFDSIFVIVFNVTNHFICY